MRGRKCRVWAIFVGVIWGICLGNPTFVAAQGKALPRKKPAATSTDPATVEFEQHLQAGKDAAGTNRWDEARLEFLKAFQLKPDNIEAVARLAQTEMATGKYREALEHLEVFLAKPGGNEADRKSAEGLLAEARSKLARVTITVDKPGAKVSVDGRVVGESPLVGPVPVEAGHRRIEAEGPAGKASVDEDFAAGTTPTVTLVLKVDKPKVVVVENKQSWRRPLMWTGIGLGVVGLGVGVGGFVASSKESTEAIALKEQIRRDRNVNERVCPPSVGGDPRCSELAALTSRSNTFENVAVAGFVVGGAASVGALILGLTGPKKTLETQKKESLLVVPAPNGFFVTGTF